MDHKTWRWKKRQSEKTIVANGEADLPSRENLEEFQFSPNEKELALQESVDILSDKLASILRDCDSKDMLMADYAQKAEAALTGQETAESEVRRLKEELNEALREKVAENDRISKLNAALKDSMQQLNSVREGEEKRVHDAVTATSKELEKAHQKLEERLIMMNKKLTNLTSENSHLNMALLDKEIVVEELSKCKAEAEAEFNVLMARLDSIEKENAFLRYEFRMLEKELDLRNEEMKFSRYSLDASHKQYLESLKKVKKLEAECQRLRLLVRKRLPGPAALANMTREVEFRSGSQIQVRARNLKPMTGGLAVRDSTITTLPDNQSKKITLMMERLRDVEGENKILKEIVLQKDGYTNYSLFGKSKPSEVDSQLTEHYKFQEPLMSLETSYDIDIDHRILSSQSSASSSILEIEKSKHENSKDTSQCKMLGVSDMSLMDDFVEMEKLAVVAVDAPIGSGTCNPSNESDLLNAASTTEISIDGTSICKAIVPVEETGFSDKDREHKKQDLSAPPDWLQHVLSIIMEQNHVSGRSLNELGEDILMALQKKSFLVNSEAYPIRPMDQPQVSGFITWKSPVTSPRVSSTDGSLDEGNLLERSRNKMVQSSLDKSIREIIELVRRQNPNHREDERSVSGFHQPSTAENYVVHVFRWKRCEIAAAIQQFLDTCNNLLEGKVNFDKFAEELAFEMGWITNCCVAAHDETLNFKDELKKCSKSSQVESEESFRSLQTELETLRVSRKMSEDQIENQKEINEDLDTQLTVANSKLNEALQKLSSLEVELEDKRHCCEELEGTCLELQLQLESITHKETQKENAEKASKLLQTPGSELSAASLKLEECQDTILQLGKQLKAITSSKETTVAAKLLTASCTNVDYKFNRRLSLLDQMQSEDGNEGESNTNSHSTRELVRTSGQCKPPILQSSCSNNFTVTDVQVATPKVGPLAIAPSKKRGGTISFLKKLLLKRKKGSNRKPSFSLTA